MPWKGVKDPYKIWLSEIILQQTRVEQGWAYYEKFIAKYPTIKHLAKANDEDAFKLWEGLGYYNRCKNLLFTARFIAEKYNGIFPASFEEIVALKGVGPYTASAIASFAYNLPHAVVDGNVFRVLARTFNISTPTDSTEGKKIFSDTATEMLDKKEPGLYNQAIMDFGATVCKPVAPLCNSCSIKKICKAFDAGIVNELPVKEKVLLKKNRWFYFFIFLCDDKVLIHKRTQKDIWENLFDFYLLESTEAIHWTDIAVKIFLKEQLGIVKFTLKNISAVEKQQLTHQQIKGQFITIELPTLPHSLVKHQWHIAAKINELAFPKFITRYLQENNNVLLP
jgi:A/G-specific adenine glycosylase